MPSLTASTSLTILNRVRAMFNPANTQNEAQWRDDNTTIKALATRQQIRFIPIMDDAGRCVDFKIWFPDMSDGARSVTYSGSTPDSGADCSLDAGTTIGTLGKTYSPNVFINDNFNVSDALCNNEATFAELVALGLSQKIRNIRRELNKQAITFLNTNASASTDTIVTGEGKPFSKTGAITYVPTAQWQSQSIVMNMGLLAKSNRLPDFMIIDGTNMYAQEWMSKFLQLNDQERSIGAIYNTIRNNYFADLLELNTEVGAEATFMVNPYMVGFFNKSKFSINPVTIDASQGMQAFSIEDPELMYMRRELVGNQVVTTQQPVIYDVYSKRVCDDTRDANGYITYSTTFEVKFAGGFILGPAGQSPNHINGILKLVKEDGI